MVSRAFIYGGDRKFAELCGAQIKKQDAVWHVPRYIKGGNSNIFTLCGGNFMSLRGIAPCEENFCIKEKVPTIKSELFW